MEHAQLTDKELDFCGTLRRILRKNDLNRSCKSTNKVMPCFFFFLRLGCRNVVYARRSTMTPVFFNIPVSKGNTLTFCLRRPELCAACKVNAIDVMRGRISSMSEDEMWWRLGLRPGGPLLDKDPSEVLRRIAVGLQLRNLILSHDCLHAIERGNTTQRWGTEHPLSVSDRQYHGAHRQAFEDVIKSLEG